MEKGEFVKGRSKWKAKKESKATTAKMEEKEKNQRDSVGDEAVWDGLTEAEARFLVVHNKYKKKTIEQKMSVSYQIQRERLNEKLKGLPMHNDLEGE
jgi:hypothetical protein